MKLFKQNDSVGGLIFKQNTNGKVMKQNYDFGKGFISTFSPSIYFDIPFAKEITGDFTILMFANKKLNSVNNPQILRVNGIANTYVQFSSGNKDNAFAVNLTPSIQQKTLTGFSYSNGVVRYISSINSIESFSKFLNEAIAFFRVGASTSTVGKLVINNIVVFNRAVGAEEMIYLKNKSLGNELLNTSGLYAQYPMNKFDIINSSFVGFQDVSGNGNHTEIKGLPAGTIEEKLLYANMNLIEKMF